MLPFQFLSMQEMRRKLQQEAAERRRLENENRGIKDPDKVRRQQLRAEEVERREEEAWRSGGGQPNLRVRKWFSRRTLINSCLSRFSGKQLNCQEFLVTGVRFVKCIWNVLLIYF